jgi:hypothetical protein
MFKKIIIGIFAFLALNSHSANNVWKDGEFLLWSHGQHYISPADFCFALRYENENIGNPVCTYAGDWERDSTVALYAKWLNLNLDVRLKPEDLRPRNQHVVERMRSLKDKSLLYSTIRNDSVWFLLFEETSLDPSKISVFSAKGDSAINAKKIASSWFGATPQRRLSDEERAAKQSKPDDYYAEQPKHDFWFGLGIGQTRAKVPLTPNSWYKRTLESRVKAYKYPRDSHGNIRDSSTVWNYLEDSSPIYSAYIGGSLFDFIGLEFELRRSSHKVKIDETDKENYSELLRWNYNRYELMMALEFMMVFKPHKAIDIKPYTSASVIYSFYSEDIKFENGCNSDNDCGERFKLDNRYYRGAALTIGLRTAFFENYALNLRSGIANQGPATTKPIIGRSTTDAFVSAALEYHIRWIF